MELSVVIPCLNESETIEICIKKALKEIKKLNIKAEIILSDNGSTDSSTQIAKKLGAKIIVSKDKGYGVAVQNGIKFSKGKYILIADADDSYNFEDIGIFYYKIKEGYDLVQGCRLPSGGGIIEKGAMPKSHRYIGNPLFSLLGKIFYSLPFNDVYCGMKILRKDFFENINFFSKGMVFCIEILIKSVVKNAKVGEVSITLYKDSRKNSKSHLKTIADGLLSLKFILICCPKWIYFIPSTFFLFISILIIIVNFNENEFYNSVLSGLLLLYLSFQFFILGLFSSLRAKKLELYRGDWLDSFFKVFNLKFSFFLSFLLLFTSGLIYSEFDILDKKIEFMLICFTIFFSISLVANSLFVSLLSLDK